MKIAIEIRKNEIVKLHGRIAGALKQSLQDAIRIGELLIETKESLPHGKFTPWIKSNLPFTVRTAQNYMKLFRGKSLVKNETVSHLTGAYNLLKQPEKYSSYPFKKTSQQILLTALDNLNIESTHCFGKHVEDKEWGACIDYCHGKCAKFNRGDDLLEGGVCQHPEAFLYGRKPDSWDSTCSHKSIWVTDMKGCPRDAVSH